MGLFSVSLWLSQAVIKDRPNRPHVVPTGLARSYRRVQDDHGAGLKPIGVNRRGASGMPCGQRSNGTPHYRLFGVGGVRKVDGSIQCSPSLPYIMTIHISFHYICPLPRHSQPKTIPLPLCLAPVSWLLSPSFHSIKHNWIHPACSSVV